MEGIYIKRKLVRGGWDPFTNPKRNDEKSKRDNLNYREMKFKKGKFNDTSKTEDQLKTGYVKNKRNANSNTKSKNICQNI